MDPVQVGKRWALVWDEEEQGFYMERPDLPGDFETPQHAHYLAMLQRLSGEEEFVETILKEFYKDYAEFRRKRSA